MFTSAFPERHVSPAEAAHPPSGAVRDLLVMGYLSAVAYVLARRGVAESRIRMGAAQDGRLRGSLDLEPAGTLSMTWDEDDGWSAARTPPRGERRFLHPARVAVPHVVSDFVAELTAGRDAGMLHPVRGGSDREQLVLDLTRYAIPEVRRWLGSQH
jgi:hypothetical protein